MSKIEEMALAYAFEGSGVATTIYDLKKLESFKAGANAILREIEKAMDLGEPPYLISTEQAYYQAIQKIKELKGV